MAQAIRTTYPFGPTQPYLSLSSALLGQSNLAFQIQVEDFASVMTSQLRLTTTNECSVGHSTETKLTKWFQIFVRWSRKANTKNTSKTVMTKKHKEKKDGKFKLGRLMTSYFWAWTSEAPNGLMAGRKEEKTCLSFFPARSSLTF